MSDKEFFEIIEDIIFTNIEDIEKINMSDNKIVIKLTNGTIYFMTITSTKQADSN